MVAFCCPFKKFFQLLAAMPVSASSSLTRPFSAVFASRSDHHGHDWQGLNRPGFPRRRIHKLGHHAGRSKVQGQSAMSPDFRSRSIRGPQGEVTLKVKAEDDQGRYDELCTLFWNVTCVRNFDLGPSSVTTGRPPASGRRWRDRIATPGSTAARLLRVLAPLRGSSGRSRRTRSRPRSSLAPTAER